MASLTITATSSGSALNVSASTLVRAGTGRVARVNVITAGSSAGSVNDIDTTGGAAIGNQLFVIPNTVGSYAVEFPFFKGLVIAPGTGQVVSVSFV